MHQKQLVKAFNQRVGSRTEQSLAAMSKRWNDRDWHDSWAASLSVQCLRETSLFSQLSLKDSNASITWLWYLTKPDICQWDPWDQNKDLISTVLTAVHALFKENTQVDFAIMCPCIAAGVAHKWQKPAVTSLSFSSWTQYEQMLKLDVISF